MIPQHEFLYFCIKSSLEIILRSKITVFIKGRKRSNDFPGKSFIFK